MSEGTPLGALLIETLGLHALYLASAALMGAGAILVGCQARAADAPAHQKTPRYIEHPRQTSGGLSVASAARNAS